VTYSAIRPIDRDDPGARIRVEYDPDMSMCAILTEEVVLPERVLRADAQHVEAFGSLCLNRADIEWLAARLGELLLEMPHDPT